MRLAESHLVAAAGKGGLGMTAGAESPTPLLPPQKIRFFPETIHMVGMYAMTGGADKQA